MNWENVGKNVAKHLCLIYDREGPNDLYFKRDIYDSSVFPIKLDKFACKQIYEVRCKINTNFFDEKSKIVIYKNNMKKMLEMLLDIEIKSIVVTLDWTNRVSINFKKGRRLYATRFTSRSFNHLVDFKRVERSINEFEKRSSKRNPKSHK